MRDAIVVAAATGRVGREVCRALERAGARWIGLTRDPSGLEAALPDLAKPHHGRWQGADFEHPDSALPALRKARALFLASPDHPRQAALETALAGLAAAEGLGRVVKLSAQSAALTPPVSFGRDHAQVEAALERAAIPTVSLQPVFFMQSLLLFADPMRRGVLPAATGKGRVAFIDLRDVADCAAASLLAPTITAGKFVLTGPESLSFAEVATRVGELSGRRVRHVNLPGWVQRLVLPLAAGVPRWQASLIVELLAAIANDAQAATTDNVRRLSGHAPRSLDGLLQEEEARLR